MGERLPRQTRVARGPKVDRAAHVLRVPQVRALREAEQEHCYVLGLDSDMRVLVVHLVAVGTANIAYPHARDVFRELIRHNCAQFIFIHNHPGGGARPSGGDHEVTAWLRHAGEWLGIPLVAHVLVPGGRRPPVDVGPPPAHEGQRGDQRPPRPSAPTGGPRTPIPHAAVPTRPRHRRRPSSGL